MAAISRPLPLPPPRRPGPVAASSAPRPAPAPARLWLCVHLPNLALEALAGACQTPLTAVEGEDGRQTVAGLNDVAARYGIRLGLKASAARALAPGLRVLERSERRERAALERLAGWARRFTPVVAFCAGGLLLEVRGSLHLFGGVDGLREAVSEGLCGLGYGHRLGVAPTPLAAEWLARAGGGEPVLDVAALPGRLGALPVAALGWPEAAVAKLEGFGARRLAQVLRLPRDGLARRLGRHWPALLDRALGRLPDPRAPFEPSSRFRATLELPMETSRREGLMPALKRLLAELEAFLTGRDTGIQALECALHHREGAPTRVVLALRRPARRAGELVPLLAHRLESVSFPAPVLSVSLRTGETRPWRAAPGDLLEREAGDSSELDELLQRLAARLGSEAVYGLEPAADHRPERAWHRTAPAAGRPGPLPACSRPLWLLPEPRPLGRGETPSRCELLNGPERIVGGWWDGHAVARDYYRARHADGRRLWVFRDLGRGGEGWFLHGIFA